MPLCVSCGLATEWLFPPYAGAGYVVCLTCWIFDRRPMPEGLAQIAADFDLAVAAVERELRR